MYLNEINSSDMQTNDENYPSRRAECERLLEIPDSVSAVDFPATASNKSTENGDESGDFGG